MAKKAARVYCVVPWRLAAKLHEPLREHFRGDSQVEVVIEQRSRERRKVSDRRAAEDAAAEERRRIKSTSGRRVADRRAPVAEIEPPTLPRFARRYFDELLFVERLEPSDEHSEDLDTARLVGRIQAGDKEGFATLYMRYFDRVYSYLRMALDDEHAAEDGTQQVFLKVMEALPRYERRSQPFRAWLFTIVRNHAIKQLQRRSRMEFVDPVELVEQREGPAEDEIESGIAALSWVTDRELLLLVERLPVSQRQVLMLRFMMDLTTSDIAAVLNRSNDDVRALQSRALRFLGARLEALGRAPQARERMQMVRRRAGAPVLRARRYECVP